MPFETGTTPTQDASGTFQEKGYQKLFRRFLRFVGAAVEPGTVTDPGAANTGTGFVQLIDAKPAAIAETWTFTCNAASSPGPATFTVVGGTTGALGDLTVDTNYENTHLAAIIEDPNTDFIIGDNFQCVFAAFSDPPTGNDIWTIDAFDYFGEDGVDGAALGTPNLEAVIHGDGTGGTDEIYLGIRLVEDVGDDVYNWEIKGLTGFNGAADFDGQPGASPSVYLALHELDHEFWLAVNGNRWVLGAQAGTRYHGAYGGFFLPLTSPAEYPYPLYAGGESASQVAKNSISVNHSSFFDPEAGGAVLRDVDGTWLLGDQAGSSATNFQTWPYDIFLEGRPWLQNMRTLPGGEYPAFPVILVDKRNESSAQLGEVIGELDGVFATTGFGLTAEDTVTIGGTDYRALQNIFRNARENYWLLRED